MLLQLGLEAREEGERVGGRPREAREHAAVVELPDLAGAALDHGLPDASPGRRRPPPPRPRWRTHTTVVARNGRSPARRALIPRAGWAASYTFIRCSGLT